MVMLGMEVGIVAGSHSYRTRPCKLRSIMHPEAALTGGETLTESPGKVEQIAMLWESVKSG